MAQDTKDQTLANTGKKSPRTKQPSSAASVKSDYNRARDITVSRARDTLAAVVRKYDSTPAEIEVAEALPGLTQTAEDALADAQTHATRLTGVVSHHATAKDLHILKTAQRILSPSVTTLGGGPIRHKGMFLAGLLRPMLARWDKIIEFSSAAAATVESPRTYSTPLMKMQIHLINLIIGLTPNNTTISKPAMRQASDDLWWDRHACNQLLWDLKMAGGDTEEVSALFFETKQSIAQLTTMLDSIERYNEGAEQHMGTTAKVMVMANVQWDRAMLMLHDLEAHNLRCPYTESAAEVICEYIEAMGKTNQKPHRTPDEITGNLRKFFATDPRAVAPDGKSGKIGGAGDDEALSRQQAGGGADTCDTSSTSPHEKTTIQRPPSHRTLPRRSQTSQRAQEEGIDGFGSRTPRGPHRPFEGYRTDRGKRQSDVNRGKTLSGILGR